MAPKNKKTPLYFFAKEYLERNGISNINDAIVQCFPEWKSLTKHERAPYEQKCVEFKEAQKKEKESNLDSKENCKFIKVEETYHGTDNVLSKDRKEVLDEFKQKAEKFNLKKQKWYFIKFQTFCKTDEVCEADNVYVLAEVGVVEFSLEEGITNEYHAFIKPLTIPPGYTAACIEKSKQYHQIPLTSFDKANNNYGQIYGNILELVRPGEHNNYYAPVFCVNDDYDEVRFGLSLLASKHENRNAIRLERKIIDMQTLVMTLAAGNGQNMSYNVANDILSSYHFDYSSNSRCEFHEELGIPYCALGYVKRYAYLISDQLCSIYQITPIAGHHVPVEKVNAIGYVRATETDFRKPAKLLRENYKTSSVRLAREKERSYDPIASTQDIRYANSTSQQQQQGRRKVSETLFSSSSTTKGNDDINARGDGLSRKPRSIFINDHDDDDDVTAYANDDGDSDDGKWTAVKSTTKTHSINTSITTSTTSRPFGRGQGSNRGHLRH